MQTRHYAVLPLLGLAATFSVLPYAKAVTTVGRTPSHPVASPSVAVVVPVASVPPQTVPSLPCGPASVAAVTPVALTAEEFPVRLLDAKQMPGFENATFLTESLWLNPNQVVNVQSGTTSLAVFDLDSGKQTSLDAINAIYQKQEVYKNPFSVRTSPDGRWLLWPSGSEEKPIWEAVTLDGQERREWPRTTFMGQPDVAWMQDSRHWVELSEFDINPDSPLASVSSRGLKVRVYDTESPQIQEFPLALEAPAKERSFLLPSQCAYTQFAFTQDGRAWLSTLWGGCSPTPQFPAAGSRLDAYELLPGEDTWTLKRSYVRLGSYAEVGTCDECVRSPDDNWLIWRNYAMDGKGPMRLVLTRTDGSDPQVIQTGGSGQNLAYIHWAADSQHVAFYRDNGISQIVLADLEAKTNQAEPCGSDQIAGRFKTTGKFPVAHPQTLLAGNPR